MSVWESYIKRISQTGNKRDALVEQSKHSIAQMSHDSLSCHRVKIDNEWQDVLITHRQATNEKCICSIPGEHLVHGGLVDFAKAKWLITELDADNEIYDRGLMLRCNYLLRWIGSDGNLKEKWCIVEDGTKYLIGEYSEDMMAIGDARIALTIRKDGDTSELCRGARFLVDDSDTDKPLAYQITKPNKLFNVYDGKGVFKFILNEVQLTKEDNVELRIADYTSWKPSVPKDGDHIDSNLTIGRIVDMAKAKANEMPDDNKKGWI